LTDFLEVELETQLLAEDAESVPTSHPLPLLSSCMSSTFKPSSVSNREANLFLEETDMAMMGMVLDDVMNYPVMVKE
jgi:hypothetical protein